MHERAAHVRLHSRGTLRILLASQMTWLIGFWRSSIGAKVTMAVTGLVLFAFVVAHLLGNLKLLAGPAALNGYAKMLSDLGGLLWAARGALLAVFVLHVATGLRLARGPSATARTRRSRRRSRRARWCSAG